MITKSAFYYKTKLSSLFKSIFITKRSLHATSWSTISYSQGTHITIPLKITITRRFGGTEKITKCVGDSCKKFFNAATQGKSSAQALLKPKESLPHAGKVAEFPTANSNFPQSTHQPLQGVAGCTKPPSGSTTNSFNSFREKVADATQAKNNTFPIPPESTQGSPSTSSMAPVFWNGFFSKQFGKGLPNTHIRGYATLTNNSWDPNSTDPQAPVNNPPIHLSNGNIVHHPEIHRNICNFAGCNGVICTGLCGKAVGSKAVGHLTHGYPTIPPSQGQVVNLDVDTDAKGLPDPQNAVIYEVAHNTASTPENIKGTQFLNQPHVKDQIEKYADKT